MLIKLIVRVLQVFLSIVVAAWAKRMVVNIAKYRAEMRARQLYPWQDGKWRAKDPTYGKIDRDIQIRVDNMEPQSLSERVVLEANLQQNRNERGQWNRYPA